MYMYVHINIYIYIYIYIYIERERENAAFTCIYPAIDDIGLANGKSIIQHKKEKTRAPLLMSIKDTLMSRLTLSSRE